MITADLLTAEQLAAALGISEDMVKRRTRSDDWPHVKFSGRTIRYRPEHAEAIIALYDQAGKVAVPRGLPGQTAASRRRSA